MSRDPRSIRRYPDTAPVLRAHRSVQGSPPPRVCAGPVPGGCAGAAGGGDGRPCLACRHQHGPAPAVHGQVALGSLFYGLDVSFLQPTSLTLLYPLAAPANGTDLYLEPMEVATFRLRLG